jgi:hypothetical protein
LTFELVKVVARLQETWTEPSAQSMRHLEEQVFPQAVNSLGPGIAAAHDYCRMAALHCDFVLQPLLYLRKSVSEPELRIRHTLGRVYPRIHVFTERAYRDVMATGPKGHIHDFSSIFDQTSDPFFADFIHLNEPGNRAVVDRLVPIVSRALPRS